ncbi:hypothetical protein ACJX0J_010540, partial [Zea mays]
TWFHFLEAYFRYKTKGWTRIWINEIDQRAVEIGVPDESFFLPLDTQRIFSKSLVRKKKILHPCALTSICFVSINVPSPRPLGFW